MLLVVEILAKRRTEFNMLVRESEEECRAAKERDPFQQMGSHVIDYVAFANEAFEAILRLKYWSIKILHNPT